MLSAEFWIMFAQGLWETVYVTVLSTLFAYIIGLPLGLLLAVTDADGLRPNPAVSKVFGTVVNLLRSVPFLIMVFLLNGLTRLIIGTTVGSPAMIPPLVIAAFPFVAGWWRPPPARWTGASSRLRSPWAPLPFRS